MKWADSTIRWIVKYGTSSMSILVGLGILIVLLVLSQTVGILSIETIFRLVVVGALLEILVILLSLREQRGGGIEYIDELPSLLKLTKEVGTTKVYCLAYYLGRSSPDLCDLVEKSNAEVHAMCHDPKFASSEELANRIRGNARNLFDRLSRTGRFHLYFTKNRPSVKAWILCDDADNVKCSIVGWYTYHANDTEVHGVARNRMFHVHSDRSVLEQQVASWSIEEFRKHVKENSATEITNVQDI